MFSELKDLRYIFTKAGRLLRYYRCEVQPNSRRPCRIIWEMDPWKITSNTSVDKKVPINRISIGTEEEGN